MQSNIYYTEQVNIIIYRHFLLSIFVFNSHETLKLFNKNKNLQRLLLHLWSKNRAQKLYFFVSAISDIFYSDVSYMPDSFRQVYVGNLQFASFTRHWLEPYTYILLRVLPYFFSQQLLQTLQNTRYIYESPRPDD